MLKISDIEKTEELDREAMQATNGGLESARDDGTLRITSGWYVNYLFDNGVIVH